VVTFGQLRPKKRSKNSPSFWSTFCFFAEWPPASAKRDTGGRILVIAVPIRTRGSAMGRATVPEATVDEDCHLQTTKGQVWPKGSTPLQGNLSVQSEADTQPMGRCADSDFRDRVG
jgi:hypothetical protein